MSVKIEKAVTDSFEMRYFKFGTGDRTAVILPGLSLKSVMGSADSVVSTYRTMKEDYTVYVFDRRTVCPEGYSIKDMADDTAEVFRLLGLGEVYLFGVSQGGMIAQQLALDHPELVRKLALCSTIARITDANSSVLKEWVKLAESNDEKALVERMVWTVFSDGFCEKYGRYIAELMGGADAEDMARFIILANSFDGFDLCGRLGEFKCPRLVIGSRADKVFPFDDIRELAERSGAQTVFYEEYGHAVYDETPDCLKHIIDFFR